MLFQDPKVIIDLEQKGTGGLEARTVTICSGLDFVNINYTPMIARDPETALVRTVIQNLPSCVEEFILAYQNN